MNKTHYTFVIGLLVGALAVFLFPSLSDKAEEEQKVWCEHARYGSLKEYKKESMGNSGVFFVELEAGGVIVSKKCEV